MVFTKRLRDRVRSGEITTSIRIWQGPKVKVGGRYAMDAGSIEVDTAVPQVLFDAAQVGALGTGSATLSVQQLGDLAASRPATLTINLS